MANYSYDASALKEKFKEQQQKVGSSGGSKLQTYKLNDPNKTAYKLKILPPVANGKNIILKEVIIHQLWGFDKVTKKRKLEGETVGPKMVDKDDPIMKEGFKLKKKFENSKNETLKNLWKIFMPKTNRYVNVIDIDEVKEKKGDVTPYALLMPNSAYNKISDVIMGTNSSQDDDEFVNTVTPEEMLNFDNSKVLVIKSNGKTGKEIRYEANFSEKTINLSSKIDIDKVMSQAIDLDKFEPAYDEKKVNDYLKTIMKKAEAIIEREGGDIIDDDLGSDDIELEEFEEDSKSSSSDDFDID